MMPSLALQISMLLFLEMWRWKCDLSWYLYGLHANVWTVTLMSFALGTLPDVYYTADHPMGDRTSVLLKHKVLVKQVYPVTKVVQLWCKECKGTEGLESLEDTVWDLFFYLA